MSARRGAGWPGSRLVIAAILWLVICPVPVSSLPAGPVVFGTTADTAVISMAGESSCRPVIRYANESFFTVSQRYDSGVVSRETGMNHTFRISGLEPATNYHYTVSGCGMQETDRTFTTVPVTGSCTFVVYGDTREQAPLYRQTERHQLVADRIAQEQGILFVVSSGDLVSDSADTGEWLRFFTATERLRSMTTYRAVPGNHDRDRVLFRQFFGTDTPAFFDCGSTRIALLDSTDASPATLDEQAGWVRSAVGTYDGAKIAVLHHPAYSSDLKHYGGWDNIQRILVPAFRDAGIRLVFNSHVHAFEQVQRDGITYITEARGGAPAYSLNQTPIPGSVTSIGNTLGYSRVTVDPEAGQIRIAVIRVADLSPDLRNITRVYPEGTVDTRIVIPLVLQKNRFPEYRRLIGKSSLLT